MNRIETLQQIVDEMSGELGANSFSLLDIQDKEADFQLLIAMRRYIEVYG